MRKLIIILLFVLVSFSLSGCLQNQIDPEVRNKMQNITLDYWRVYDGPDIMQPLISKYQAMHPNIKINYKKLRYEEYEQAMLEAFATDRGPDIFSIHNTWVHEYQDRGFLAPLPGSITMVFPSIKGSIKKEVVYDKRKYSTYTPAKLKDIFVDTVYEDVVVMTEDEKTGSFKEKIYGLPLSLDTLSLFYNKDLFNNAGITKPPEYWNREFQQDVKKLTKQNNKGEFIQSGVSLGGSDNIVRSADILSILMMQNGTVMMNGNKIRFNVTPDAFETRNYNPGVDSLRFYTDFANPAKEVYSWNSSLENSTELFIQNKLAMMFGYAYMLEDIQNRAPKLNFSITKLPQIEGNLQQVNFANYWVETVSKKSKNTDEAWDFIYYITQEKRAKNYLAATGKPPALRALIDEMKDDEELGVFVDQVLTAKSWYRGVDANTAEAAMKDMIDQVNTGQGDINAIIGRAAKKVQQTLPTKN